MFEDIGAVILADNTDEFNYVELAKIAATRVKKHLNIPVALITSEDVTESICFDKIIKANQPKYNSRVFKHNERATWRNLNRTLAYDLSPWHRTLLIDADFLITSNALANHVYSKVEFAIAKDIYDPVTGYVYTKTLGSSKIPQMWATLMMFDKTSNVEKIFTMAQHVIDHYEYYSKLYNFNVWPIRNDYAFSVACHVIGGYGITDYSLKNYNMFNCDFNTELLELNSDNFLIGYKKQNKVETKTFVQRLKNTDVHFQDKKSLFARIT